MEGSILILQRQNNKHYALAHKISPTKWHLGDRHWCVNQWTMTYDTCICILGTAKNLCITKPMSTPHMFGWRSLNFVYFTPWRLRCPGWPYGVGPIWSLFVTRGGWCLRQCVTAVFTFLKHAKVLHCIYGIHTFSADNIPNTLKCDTLIQCLYPCLSCTQDYAKVPGIVSGSGCCLVAPPPPPSIPPNLPNNPFRIIAPTPICTPWSIHSATFCLWSALHL